MELKISSFAPNYTYLISSVNAFILSVSAVKRVLNKPIVLQIIATSVLNQNKIISVSERMYMKQVTAYRVFQEE